LLLLIEDEAQRCWMGRVDEDGSEHWCEHDGDVESLLTGQGAA
jgi:hypothetical protein